MRPSPSPPLLHRLGWFVMALILFATVAFLIAPIVLTVVVSLAASRTGILPSGSVTLENWRAVLEFTDTIGSQRSMGWSLLFRLPPDGETLVVLVPAELVFNIGLAFGGVLISLVVGVPIAYTVTRYEFPGREWANAVSVSPPVPGVIPSVVFLRTYPDPLAMSFRLTVGYSLLKAPFMVAVVQNEFESMPLRQLEESACSLGASWPQTFLTAIVLNTRSGTVSGAITRWALVAAEFNFPYIVWVNGTQPPVLLLQRYISNSSFTKAAAVMSMFFFIIVMATLLSRRVGCRGFDIRGNQ